MNDARNPRSILAERPTGGEPIVHPIMWCWLCWGTGTDLDFSGPCEECEGTGHFNTINQQVTAFACNLPNCVGCNPTTVSTPKDADA